MLNQVAEAVLVHQSEFILTNSTVVLGPGGVLLVDPGLQDFELACLADDLDQAGLAVAAGFATHPHWDHMLWHARFGGPPRWATALGAATVREELADPGAKAAITEHLEPAGIAERVPLELYGQVTALPEGAERVPWDGPRARILEHRAHEKGHAALLFEELGVLVAGDMLSDVLVPMPDMAAEDPLGDYLAALDLLEGAAGGVDAVIPGHGTVGDGAELRVRIERDRAYVHALRDGRTPDDPRIGPGAAPGWEWVADIYEGQARRFAEKGGREG